jgi:hypothetical protein
MAKISTYVTDSNVTGGDMLIGTDVDNSNATKNFTVSSLIAYAATNDLVPYTGATQDVNLGANNLSLESLTVNNGISLTGELFTLGSSGTVNQILVSQGVGLSPVWADNAAVSIPISSGLSAQGTDNTTTSLMSQGINIFSTVTITNFCTKLPNVATGISVRIINNGVTNLRVFPYDPADSINGLPAGAYATVPNDNKLYEFISL